MDTCMTTHGPIKPIRTRSFVDFDDEGRCRARYSTHNFVAHEELDLEEVIQVLGTEYPFIVEVFGCPPELVEGSLVNVASYMEYLRQERTWILEKVIQRIQAERWELSASTTRRDPGEVERAMARLDEIERMAGRGRIYLRPKRSSDTLSHMGYEEAGFYVQDGSDEDPVRIFATYSESADSVWLKDYVRPPVVSG